MALGTVEAQSFTMLIPEDQIGRVIGAKGSNLQRLRAETGADVKVARDGPQPETRSVDMTGTAEQIAAAQASITAMLASAPPGGAGNKRKAPEQLTPNTAGWMDPGHANRMARHTYSMIPSPVLGMMPGMIPGMMPGMMPTQGLPQPPPLVPGYNQPTATAVQVLVDENKVGLVVGKQGSVLKMVREATGVKMDVEREAIIPGQRVVTLNGSANAIWASLGVVGELVADIDAATSAPIASLGLLFANHHTGRVIGKAGAGLKELRQNGVTVDVPRDAVGAGGQRMLCVKGPIAGVVNAISSVVQKLADFS